jgi:F-type H+-transporting ATPase subunit beta
MAIVQVIGAVVDVQFAHERIPPIYNAIEIQLPDQGKLVLEVQQHIGEGVLRTLAIPATDGLRCDIDVLDAGNAIIVPIGDGVLGRI